TLKAGRSQEAKAEASAEVRSAVESILADVAERGDGAVRHYSESFDGWTPESFLLTESEIEACVASVPEQTVDDVRFAQEQIRGFALAQRGARAGGGGGTPGRGFLRPPETPGGAG